MALFDIELKELLRRFISLQTIRDIANLLEIKYASLIYYVRKVPDGSKYIKFCIPKKSGGEREIYAPIPPLRFIQRKLNFILQNNFTPHYCVHGFINNRNIVSNANCHTKQEYIINIDLKDFFPSINFGRVRGIFMSYPFRFNPTVATFLAQICTYNNQLPQGAPTSPIISNYICARLDRQLLNFSRESNCRYTRYADDLTLSTYLPKFSERVLITEPDIGKYSVILSDEIKQMIVNNGFLINESKVRLRSKRQRQEVTGLIVNKFPNVNRKLIRQVRAMLHAWQKFGLEKAEQEYFLHYDKLHRNHDIKKPNFSDIVRGKINYIGMVRGKDDVIYRNFCKKLRGLDSRTRMKVELKEKEKIPLIVTEGSSDWKHLKAAFRSFKREGLFRGLNLRFSEYKGTMGHSPLQIGTQLKQAEIEVGKTIYIFDSDIGGIVKQVNDHSGNPRYWGNHVYSFSIPVPSHRTQQRGVSIELYYTDEEIRTKDAHDRRLFLNNEFDSNTRNHLEGICRCCGDSNNKLSRNELCIIDSYDIENGWHVAMSKNQFAEHILEAKDDFANFNFTEFKRMFEIIEKIIIDAKNHY